MRPCWISFGRRIKEADTLKAKNCKISYTTIEDIPLYALK